MNIYFISGLGANCLVFEKLNLPDYYHKIYLDWEMPSPEKTLEDYAKAMSNKIDTSVPFVLIGLSFGGILCLEMAKFISPRCIIEISSVQSRKQMPWFIRWNRKFPIYKYIPSQVFTHKYITKFYGGIRQRINKKYPPLDKIYTFRDRFYIQWSFNQIINWAGASPSAAVYQIHGSRDIVFPISNISNCISIQGGTHMMVYERAEEVSRAILGILENLQ